MSLLADFDGTQVKYERREIKQYYRVLHDDEMNYPSRAGDGTKGNPQVHRLEPHHYVTLNGDRSHQWFNCNRSPDWKKDHEEWLKYTESSRAFTNGNGILEFDIRDGDQQIRCDHIGKTRYDLPDPKIATLVCGLNVICGEEVVLDFPLYNMPVGTRALKVETIRDPKMVVSRQTHPHLVFVANIIYDKIAPNGLRQVNAFPQRGGREGQPVYVPLVSNVQVYFPMSKLEKLPLGAPIPPYYNPP